MSETKEMTVSPQESDIIAQIVLSGDIGSLHPQQRVQYYRSVCERVGIDPMLKPFDVLKLQGKHVLYLNRSGAQQLNRLHRISHTIVSRETMDGIYIVTARAESDGRHTESIGAVSIANLKGDALCNALMKAETKAKRRATLDLIGLGWLDETETETMPRAITEDIVVQAEPEPVEIVAQAIRPDQHKSLEATITSASKNFGLDHGEFRSRIKKWVSQKYGYAGSLNKISEEIFKGIIDNIEMFASTMLSEKRCSSCGGDNAGGREHAGLRYCPKCCADPVSIAESAAVILEYKETDPDGLAMEKFSKILLAEDVGSGIKI